MSDDVIKKAEEIYQRHNEWNKDYYENGGKQENLLDDDQFMEMFTELLEQDPNVLMALLGMATRDRGIEIPQEMLETIMTDLINEDINNKNDE